MASDATPPPLDDARSAETEIELFDPVVEMEESDNTDELGAPVASTALSVSSLTRSRARRADAKRAGPLEGLNAEAPAQEGTTQDGYALDPTARAPNGAATERSADGAPVQLGIGAGDWSRWVDPTAAPAREGSGRSAFRAPPVSSTGGLAEALEARDQALGLGPAGAVLTAVHEAGYSDIAPALGTATFSITVLRSGAIDVQLTGASSQTAQWTKVGESIAAAIRRKPPRIADTRIGVRLGIEVVAEERWPNGQATRSSQGPKIAAEGLKFQPTETAKEELLDRNPAAVPDPDAPADKPKLQANFRAPGVFVEGKGKVCSYRIGLSPIPFSGGCDPTNIGQPARRVVSTRVVSQTML